MTPPLVSIGIPTFNRAATLPRSVESALRQDYPELEVVVSDNASEDGTQALCERLARSDARVRYIRQPENRGGPNNFREVLRAARGDFFMWLGDDDWLDPSYVSTCVARLQQDPGLSLVCGKVVYYRDGQPAFRERPFSTDASEGVQRVLAYYRQVHSNGTFYGVMRRKQLSAVPIPDANCGDWPIVASMAYLGRIETVSSVAVHRMLGGASGATVMQVAESGLLGFFKRNSYWFVAKLTSDDIRCSVVYDSLPLPSRVGLASKVFTIVLMRHSGFFFLTRMRERLGLPGGIWRWIRRRTLPFRR